MIKRVFEEKEVTKMENVLIEEKLICDICEKEIAKGKGYYELATSHNDWGNDSFESSESFDVCSKECLTEKFNEYLTESESGRSTNRFEVEHTTR